MWTTSDLAWSAGVPLSRIGWGQTPWPSPDRASRWGSWQLSPAHQQLVPTVVPKQASRYVMAQRPKG
jgi:hypothetical protein